VRWRDSQWCSNSNHTRGREEDRKKKGGRESSYSACMEIGIRKLTAAPPPLTRRRRSRRRRKRRRKRRRRKSHHHSPSYSLPLRPSPSRSPPFPRPCCCCRRCCCCCRCCCCGGRVGRNPRGGGEEGTEATH
jgi:hypothetical protein